MIGLILAILTLIAWWKLFEKAGREGWEGIVPIYNIYVLMLIIKRPWWWVFLFFIPVVNIIIAIITTIDFLRCFRVPKWHIILAILFSGIYWIYLAFVAKTDFYEPAEIVK